MYHNNIVSIYICSNHQKITWEVPIVYTKFFQQRWARTYRDTVYHAAVETNNGTEALNKLFKYKYLPRQKHMTLSHIISSITNEFLPALHYKYVFKNFKQSDLYRSYNPAVVPEYLQGRPKQTILHCLHRLASSNKFSHSDVTQAAPNSGKFPIKSNKGSQTVEFEDQSGEPKCTCKDWLTYHLPCKHFFAVFRHFPEWGWEKLPGSYLMSPYLSLDNQAISNYINPEEQISLNACSDEASLDFSELDEIPRKVIPQYMYNVM